MQHSFEVEALQKENARLKRYLHQFGALDDIHRNKPQARNENDHVFLGFIQALFSSTTTDVLFDKAVHYLGAQFDLTEVLLYELFQGQFRLTAGFGEGEGVSHHLKLNLNDDFLVELKSNGFVWLDACNSQWFGVAHTPVSSKGMVFGLVKHGNLAGFLLVHDRWAGRTWMEYEHVQLLACCRIMERGFERAELIRDIRQSALRSGIILELSGVFNQHLAVNEQLERVLQILGHSVEAKSVFLCEILPNQGHCSCMMEWLSPEEEGGNQFFNGLAYPRDFLLWDQLFKSDGRVCALKLREQLQAAKTDFPPGFPDAFVAFPVFSGTRFFGFLGIVPKNGTHACVDFGLQEVVGFVAGIVEGMIAQRQSMETIQTMNTHLLDLNEQLSGKEKLLQSIVGSVPMGILLISNRKVVYVNDYLSQMGNHLPGALLDRSVEDFYSYYRTDSIPLLEAFLLKVQKDGYDEIELDVFDDARNEFRVHYIGCAGPEVDGNQSILLVVQDVTKEVYANKMVLESDERYRRILEKNSAGVVIFDRNKDLVYINPSACSIMGYCLEEIAPIPIEEFAAEPDFMIKVELGFQQIELGNDFQTILVVKNKNGKVIRLEVEGTPITLQSAPHYYFSLRDVTKEWLHENQLKQSEQKYRDLTENSQDYILRFGRDGELLFYNGATQRVFFTSEGLYESIAHLLLDYVRKATTIGRTLNYEMEIPHHTNFLVVDWTIIPESNSLLETASVLLVGRDYTLRKQAEIELKHAVEQSELADRLKSAFLANMSHEIRTPINAIVGFGSLLKEAETEADRQVYIDIMNKSSDNLLHLIDDIVDVAKIESGELSLNAEAVNLDVLMQNLFLVYARKINEMPEKSVHLEYVSSLPKGLIVKADQSRLYQVMSHLLDNAVKFTSEGAICFGYSLEHNQIRCYVKDTGEGIEATNQEVIFDLFRQLELHPSRKHGGIGLGLSLCRKLVNAMGGQIGVQSSRNEGAEFFFSLPHSQKERIGIEESAGLVQLPLNLNGAWTDKVILLVDEDSSMHLMVRRYLEQTGATLISARSIQSAYKLVCNRTDIHLMLLSEVWSSMIHQSNPGWEDKELPLVCLTSEMENSGKYAGPRAFLQKPFSKEEFLSMLSDLLEDEKK